MKRYFFIAMALVAMATSANAALKGDINGDGKVDVSDATMLVSQVLGTSEVTSASDITGDGNVDVSDVTSLMNLILNGSSEEVTPAKLVGGDISMLTKYEENGAIYYDQDGNKVTDMLAFYKSIGQNAMRVRLFVDPSQDTDRGVIQDLTYVSVLGKNIKDHGLQFVLDFHYSDSWADPSKQKLPSSWSSCTVDQLVDSMYAYTKRCLQTLVAAGAKPDMVQVGNETTYGMLWTYGHCWPSGADYSGGTWDNYVKFFNSGAKAVREVLPNAKVISHIELSTLGNASAYCTTAKSKGLDYDIIGLSYYPAFHATSDYKTISDLETVIKTLEANFDQKIMIMETGYSYAWAMNGTKDRYTGSKYAYSEDGQASFVTDLVTMLNSHEKVTGLFWWWPEQNEYGLDWNTKRVTDSWWNASLVDSRTGKILQGNYNLANFVK